MLLEEIKNIRSSRRELKNFGLTVGSVLLLIGLILWYYNRPSCPYFVIIGVVLVLSGWLLPAILKPLQKAWMALAVVLGFFMTRLILAGLFFLVFTPIHIAGLICRHSFLDLKMDKSASSYWCYRKEPRHRREGSEKQF